MRYVKLISFLLVIIGALNWGLVGVFNFDLVARLMGDMTVWSRIVYALVGAGGLVSLVAMAANAYISNLFSCSVISLCLLS